MSVMDELKNVVTEARRLFGEVSGKMKQIDRKVDEATSSVPTTVRSMMEISTWVDSSLGNDQNDGNSSNQAKKTLVAALNRGVSGCNHTILITEGSVVELTESISLTGQSISILSASASTKERRAKIAFSTNDEMMPSLLTIANCDISFRGCEIIHPSHDGKIAAGTSVLYHCLIRSISSTVMLDYRNEFASTVKMGNSKMSRFMASDRGLSSLVLSRAEATGNEGILIENRVGGASMLRATSFVAEGNIKMIPESSESISSRYFI